MEKPINSFIDYHQKELLQFGDFILFQEYKYNNIQFVISKPILAIYLGSFIADQTFGFNYIKWVNDKRGYKNEQGIYVFNEAEKIESHIEWFDYINILGHWNKKPSMLEILSAYRKQTI